MRRLVLKWIEKVVSLELFEGFWWCSAGNISLAMLRSKPSIFLLLLKVQNDMRLQNANCALDCFGCNVQWSWKSTDTKVCSFCMVWWVRRTLPVATEQWLLQLRRSNPIAVDLALQHAYAWAAKNENSAANTLCHSIQSWLIQESIFLDNKILQTRVWCVAKRDTTHKQKLTHADIERQFTWGKSAPFHFMLEIECLNCSCKLRSSQFHWITLWTLQWDVRTLQ
jgi:hypothetical protein